MSQQDNIFEESFVQCRYLSAMLTLHAVGGQDHDA